MHGWARSWIGPSDAFLEAFADMGFTPPALWFWASTAIEFAGRHRAYPRPVHALLRRRRGHRDAVHLRDLLIGGNGFAWLKRGYEYVLLWGLVCLAIALRGGGPYSLDRKLGREL